ncbi:MAG TPA: DUF1810 domain-containing protein [Rubrivivax sp.]|nr:DUF1810 domain-containing protein [Rubrivivax sp.]
MTTPPDPLQRFVDAQAPVFDHACAELAAGRKRTHWMWFVFPQLRGLGRSATAMHYGIDSRDEALAYWHHPLLGPRLARCATLVLAQAGRRSAHDIFGSPDDLKLCSCMTLFDAVAPEQPVFRRVLDAFYGGRPDARTLAHLGQGRDDGMPAR